MKKKFFNRVDVQVAILVAVIVIVSNGAVFWLVYSMSYQEMINILSREVLATAADIDKELPGEIFTMVSSKEDMQGDLYEASYEYLKQVRESHNMKYLYTAKFNEQGEMIYHIDGLDEDDPDFRFVGDLMEEEFQEPLLTALNDEIVVPNDILNTEWGSVFVAYYPIHDENGEVVAALGMEFNADQQYQEYMNIRIYTSIFIGLVCIASVFIAHSLFKRISNPHFKDIYNTDSLTKLKNRNAYDTDMQNRIQTKQLEGITLVLTDLNALKLVNDQYGHKTGDFYICACASALSVVGMEYCISYRLGGDEFVTVIPKEQGQHVSRYIDAVKKNLVELCEEQIEMPSVSMGYAVCEHSTIAAWEKAQHDSDLMMYQDKRAFYEKNQQMNARK